MPERTMEDLIPELVDFVRLVAMGNTEYDRLEELAAELMAKFPPDAWRR